MVLIGFLTENAMKHRGIKRYKLWFQEPSAEPGPSPLSRGCKRRVCYIEVMKKTLITTTAGFLGAMAVSACSQPQAKGQEPPMLGMANPASVYCGKLGGKLRIEKTTAGERGICMLPDGTEMEEWALFRRDHPAQ